MFEIYGQDEVAAQMKVVASSPVHSYIFSGPRSFPAIGAGGEAPMSLLRAAACEFAANLFSENSEEDMEMARKGQHINLRFIEPEGRSFRVADADLVIEEIYLMPRKLKNGISRKVVVCDYFHTADEAVQTRLLKVIEEPPESSILILLTEEKLPATIVSRCMEINFSPVPKALVKKYLAERNVKEEHLEMLSEAAGGDLGQAHFLALNDTYDRRFQIWGDLPNNLTASGSAIVNQVQKVKDFLDEMNEELEELFKSDESIKREKRRIRDLEIRFGLFILQKYFHQQLLENSRNVGNNLLDFQIAQKIKSLNDALSSLDRNPNENTFLSNLFFKLVA